MLFLRVFLGFLMGLFLPGFILVSTLFRDELNKLEKFVFSVAISFGILHIIVTGMAIFMIKISFFNILLSELILVTILSLLFIKAKWNTIKRRERLPRISKNFLPFTMKLRQQIHFEDFLIISFTITIVFLPIYNVIQIPIIRTFDGLVYEPICRYIFERGRYPWFIFPDAIYVPQYAYVYEMRHILTLGSWMYMCYGDVEDLLPMLAVSFLGIVTLVALFSMSLRRNRSLSSAIIVPALMVLVYDFIRPFTDFHNDIPFIFFWIVTTYSFYLLIREKQKKYMLLSGFILGFSLITKAQALILPIAVIVFVIFEFASNVNRIRSLNHTARTAFWSDVKLVVGALLIGFSISSFYFLHNWILFGNPLYPLFTSILGGDKLTASFLHSGRIVKYHGVSPFSLEYVIYRFLAFLNLGPFRSERNPLIPILCFFGFLILASNLKKRQENFLLINCLIYFLSWFFYADIGHRLLTPIYGILLVPFSSIARVNDETKFERRQNKRIHRWNPTKIFFILILFLPLFGVALNLSNVSSVGTTILYNYFGGNSVHIAIVGRYDPFDPDINFLIEHFTNPLDKETVFKAWRGDFCDAWKFINKNLPEDAVILTTDTRAVYGSERRMIWDGNKGINQIHLQSDIGDVLKILKAYNITYFLYAQPRTFKERRESIGFKDAPLLCQIDDERIFKLIWIGKGEGKNLAEPIRLYKIDYTSIT